MSLWYTQKNRILNTFTWWKIFISLNSIAVRYGQTLNTESRIRTIDISEIKTYR